MHKDTWDGLVEDKVAVKILSVKLAEGGTVWKKDAFNVG